MTGIKRILLALCGLFCVGQALAVNPIDVPYTGVKYQAEVAEWGDVVAAAGGVNFSDATCLQAKICRDFLKLDRDRIRHVMIALPWTAWQPEPFSAANQGFNQNIIDAITLLSNRFQNFRITLAVHNTTWCAGAWTYPSWATLGAVDPDPAPTPAERTIVGSQPCSGFSPSFNPLWVLMGGVADYDYDLDNNGVIGAGEQNIKIRETYVAFLKALIDRTKNIKQMDGGVQVGGVVGYSLINESTSASPWSIFKNGRRNYQERWKGINDIYSQIRAYKDQPLNSITQNIIYPNAGADPGFEYYVWKHDDEALSYDGSHFPSKYPIDLASFFYSNVDMVGAQYTTSLRAARAFGVLPSKPAIRTEEAATYAFFRSLRSDPLSVGPMASWDWQNHAISWEENDSSTQTYWDYEVAYNYEGKRNQGISNYEAFYVWRMGSTNYDSGQIGLFDNRYNRTKTALIDQGRAKNRSLPYYAALRDLTSGVDSFEQLDRGTLSSRPGFGYGNTDEARYGRGVISANNALLDVSDGSVGVGMDGRWSAWSAPPVPPAALVASIESVKNDNSAMTNFSAGSPLWDSDVYALVTLPKKINGAFPSYVDKKVISYYWLKNVDLANDRFSFVGKFISGNKSNLNLKVCFNDSCSDYKSSAVELVFTDSTTYWSVFQSVYSVGALLDEKSIDSIVSVRIENNSSINDVEFKIDDFMINVPSAYDWDADGIVGAADLKPFYPRAAFDDDGDGVQDVVVNDVAADNCDGVDASQRDSDADGVGDACDADADGDSFYNDSDLCPLTFSVSNNGSFCDLNDDGDSSPVVPDIMESIAGIAALLPDNEDYDGDADIGDDVGVTPDNPYPQNNVDTCPLIAHANNVDGDGDGLGDICDEDADGDGILDTRDATWGAGGLDADSDGLADGVDGDDDGDGFIDAGDNDAINNFVHPSRVPVAYAGLYLINAYNEKALELNVCSGLSLADIVGVNNQKWNFILRENYGSSERFSVKSYDESVCGVRLLSAVGGTKDASFQNNLYVQWEMVDAGGGSYFLRNKKDDNSYLARSSSGDWIIIADLPAVGHQDYNKFRWYVDRDVDSDGLIGLFDNCGAISNPDQLNTDGDGDGGDACDADDDNDGVDDVYVGGFDNCPLISNALQVDTDGDLQGDACDATPNGPDLDGDGVGAVIDNCDDVPNASQSDRDGDNAGNACDSFLIADAATSAANHDGWILGLSGTPNTTSDFIQVGDNINAYLFRGFLDFSLASDITVLSSVSIALSCTQVTGSPGSISIDMAAPYFGQDPSLVATDSNNNAGVLQNVGVGSAMPQANTTYQVQLNESALNQINSQLSNGIRSLQLRLATGSTGNSNNDYFSFGSANHQTSECRPRLIAEGIVP